MASLQKSNKTYICPKCGNVMIERIKLMARGILIEILKCFRCNYQREK